MFFKIPGAEKNQTFWYRQIRINTYYNIIRENKTLGSCIYAIVFVINSLENILVTI